MKSFIGVFTVLLLLQISSSLSVHKRYASSDNKISARITDGKDAHPGQFPHQISIQWGVPPCLPYQHNCGGAIINEHWILTAGHCFLEAPEFGHTKIKVGMHHILADDKYVQEREIEKVIVHEKFAGGAKANDIALIKVHAALSFNERVQPVQLPTQRTSASGQAVLSGWGSVSRSVEPILPPVLQTVTVPIIDNENCENVIKSVDPQGQIVNSMLCTGPLNGTISACVGDSGGPLIQYENEKPVIVGIVSWGLYPCGNGKPSVYTRVSSFVDWINAQINKN